MNWPKIPFLDWCRSNPLPEAAQCPATQAVHREVSVINKSTTKLLLREVYAATGRRFPAVENMVGMSL